jgi:hypothetical protein
MRTESRTPLSRPREVVFTLWPCRALVGGPTAEAVRRYKRLAQIERAFRRPKTVDLKVRPIHNRTADRVRAHLFLGMLA